MWHAMGIIKRLLKGWVIKKRIEKLTYKDIYSEPWLSVSRIVADMLYDAQDIKEKSELYRLSHYKTDNIFKTLRKYYGRRKEDND